MSRTRLTAARYTRWLILAAMATLLPFALLAHAQDTEVSPAGERAPVLGMAYDAATPGQVKVIEVEAESAAELAGLAGGDVVRTFNGVAIADGPDLAARLTGLRAGEKAKLGVQRGRRVVELIITGPQASPVPTRVGLMGATLKLDKRNRITVSEVSPNTPASVAGLKPGDILVSVSGYEPESIEALVTRTARVVRAKQPGDRLTITILRGDEEGQLALTIPESDDDIAAQSPAVAASAPQPQDPLESRTVALAVTVAESQQGLQVVEVVPGGPAEEAGIQPGDILLAIQGQKMPTYAHLASAVRTFVAPGEPIDVDVLRGDRAFVAQVKVMGTMAPIPDVALATSGPQAAATSQQLTDEVRLLRSQVDELTAVVNALAQEVEQLRADR